MIVYFTIGGMDRKDHIDSKSMQPGVTPGFPANKFGIRILLDGKNTNLIIQRSASPVFNTGELRVASRLQFTPYSIRGWDGL